MNDDLRALIVLLILAFAHAICFIFIALGEPPENLVLTTGNWTVEQLTSVWPVTLASLIVLITIGFYIGRNKNGR